MRSRIRNHNALALTALALCIMLQGCHGKQDTQPAPGTPAAPSAEAPVLSIPIQRGAYWVAEVRTADNQPHGMLLDTGASINAMGTQGALAATPLSPRVEGEFLRQGTLRAPTTNGTVDISTTSAPKSVKLGLTPMLRIQNWAVPVGTLAAREDMAPVSAAGDGQFSGIIGSESMRNLTWRADYVTGQLSAYANEAPGHAWQQCLFMTLDPEQRIPIVEVGLRNEFRWMNIDTGNEGEVELPQETFDAISNMFADVGTSFHYDLTNQIAARPTGILAGLTLGQQRLPKISVSGDAAMPRLGLGALSKMDRFELDFRHYRFCFDLRSVPVDSTLDPSGAALLRSGERFDVAALAPDGKLAASGFQVGDQITMVDKTSTAKLKYADLYDLLNNPATEQVTVQRGGSTLQLKLKTD